MAVALFGWETAARAMKGTPFRGFYMPRPMVSVPDTGGSQKRIARCRGRQASQPESPTLRTPRSLQCSPWLMPGPISADPGVRYFSCLVSRSRGASDACPHLAAASPCPSPLPPGRQHSPSVCNAGRCCTCVACEQCFHL